MVVADQMNRLGDPQAETEGSGPGRRLHGPSPTPRPLSRGVCRAHRSSPCPEVCADPCPEVCAPVRRCVPRTQPQPLSGGVCRAHSPSLCPPRQGETRVRSRPVSVQKRQTVYFKQLNGNGTHHDRDWCMVGTGAW